MKRTKEKIQEEIIALEDFMFEKKIELDSLKSELENIEND